MKCEICYENIHIFYYKSPCKCNIYYHNDCIIEWYNKNKSCIQCRKKDTIKITDIYKKQNKLLENIVLLLSILFCIIIIYTLHI